MFEFEEIQSFFLAQEHRLEKLRESVVALALNITRELKQQRQRILIQNQHLKFSLLNVTSLIFYFSTTLTLQYFTL